ncbi:hypothetical protein P3T76_014408 [Phytophthora citrophthora]|uniref:Crinkler effector protein N-terminal domain-containing protein n=1 Tax=Phytophthora citrophthora TaxID=4793 RepID=A0AAD9G1Y6_9STRA|nr:hypothetical protein P3T76_014408 [Phytophthora citrophthora]
MTIKKNKADTITCDVKNLQLFLAKKGGAWLDEAEAKTVTPTEAETQFVEMNPMLWLKNKNHFGANFEPDESQVHILVVVPEMPPGKSRKWGELNTICEFGQGLNRDTDLATGELLQTSQEVLGVNVRKGVYIRQEYWDVYEILKENLQSSDEINRVLVVGSPGIGKSVFGVFLLLLFISEHKNVAYRSFGSDAKLNYFTWNDVENQYETSLNAVLGNRYEGLFDGNKASGAWKDTIFEHSYLFADPQTENYNEFVQERCIKIYMNPWSKTECQAYWDAVELEDEMEWYHRYNLVGGKPRFVFSAYPTFESLVDEVKSVIPTEDEQLKSMVRGGGEMKHILFEIYRDVSNPSLYFVELASGVIQNMVLTMNSKYIRFQQMMKTIRDRRIARENKGRIEAENND